MISNEERLARIEGGYEHLATKADIGDVKAEIAGAKAEIAALNGRIDALEARIDAVVAELRIHRWALGISIALQLIILARLFEIIPPG